jgi:hypothetical protein
MGKNLPYFTKNQILFAKFSTKNQAVWIYRGELNLSQQALHEKKFFHFFPIF